MSNAFVSLSVILKFCKSRALHNDQSFFSSLSSIGLLVRIESALPVVTSSKCFLFFHLVLQIPKIDCNHIIKTQKLRKSVVTVLCLVAD